MNFTEIKTAVLAGKTVHWASDANNVIYAPRIDQFLIKCSLNDNCNGLTCKDGRDYERQAEPVLYTVPEGMEARKFTLHG